MTTYIIRRILLMIPTLLGITVVVFAIMAFAPGDVTEMLLNSEGEMQPGEKQIRQAYLKRRYGLDKPLVVQYLRWLNKVSPFGFESSSQVAFEQADIDAALAKVKNAKHLMAVIKPKEALDTVIAIAAYQDDPLVEVTERVIVLSTDANNILNLLVELDVFDEEFLDSPALKPPDEEPKLVKAAVTTEEREKEDREFVGHIKWLLANGDARLNKKIIERMRNDAAGLDRVLFSRPTFKTPDFGESFTKRRPVIDLLAEAIPITLLLNLLSLPLVYSLAIGSGVYAARFRGQAFDILSGFTMLAMWSIPVIWAGVMLQGLFANVDGWVKWFPTTGLHSLESGDMPFLPFYDTDGAWQAGWLLDLVWHLFLPVICLSYGGFAFVSKLTRGAVLENIMADYVRTARAKGLTGRAVLWRHAFRNSLLPLITVAAFVVPGLLSGSIIVESIFGIEGMGKLAIESIKFKDQEVVMAVTLISGLLTLSAYLVADILYALVDPRVAYE